MSGTEDSNQRWLDLIYTTNVIWKTVYNKHSKQICIQSEIRIDYKLKKKVSFKQFKTTGGANENFTNLIIKENEI